MSNSKDMDTEAICSTVQQISTKGNSGSHIPPHANSASKQHQPAEDNKHIQPPWLQTDHHVQVHRFNSEFNMGVGWNIMLLYIYRTIFGDSRLEPPVILISGYGDSPVANKGSGITILLTGCQTPRKSTFQVTDMTGYLILDREMVQQIVYIYFPKISPPKLAQQPKKHTHLKNNK